MMTMRKRSLAAILTLLFFTGAADAQQTGSVIRYADPTILADSGKYYLYGTGPADRGFQAYVSRDLVHWYGPAGRDSGFVLRKGGVYGQGGFWAPQIFRYRGWYYLAYAADEHVALARGTGPLGPFRRIRSGPLLPGKAIDPFVFRDGDRIYLYYVKLDHGNRIFVTRLREDLSGTVPGTTRPCVNGVTDPQPWEHAESAPWTVTEGPAVLKHGGRYYLFYSANDFRSVHYAVGYAVSDSPLGPWKKFSGNPVLDRGLIGENGPGHGDFFPGAAGHGYYVFHTHASDSAVSPRKTALIGGRFSGTPATWRFDSGTFRYLRAYGPLLNDKRK